MDYYQHDLALVHDRGYGHHADRCAPGIRRQQGQDAPVLAVSYTHLTLPTILRV